MRVRHVIYAVGTTLWLVLSVATTAPSASGRARSPQAASAEPPAAQPNMPIMLEFDLPDGYQTRAKDNTYVVTGFRVGVFKPKVGAPVTTIDFTREQVTVNGDKGRVSIDRGRLPPNVDGRVLRVQTLAGQVTSPWSDPSPSVSGAPKAARGTKKEERTTPNKTEKHLTMVDIERHPRLLEAFRKVLPADVKAEDLAAQFRTAKDLAVSVVISEHEKIPLEKLSASMQGPPTRNLPAALRELRPDWDSRSALKKARQQSKALLKPSK